MSIEDTKSYLNIDHQTLYNLWLEHRKGTEDESNVLFGFESVIKNGNKKVMKKATKLWNNPGCCAKPSNMFARPGCRAKPGQKPLPRVLQCK